MSRSYETKNITANTTFAFLKGPRGCHFNFEFLSNFNFKKCNIFIVCILYLVFSRVVIVCSHLDVGGSMGVTDVVCGAGGTSSSSTFESPAAATL